MLIDSNAFLCFDHVITDRDSAWITFDTVACATEVKESMADVEQAPGVPLNLEYAQGGEYKDYVTEILSKRDEDEAFGLRRTETPLKLTSRTASARVLGMITQQRMRSEFGWDWKPSAGLLHQPKSQGAEVDESDSSMKDEKKST